jgi:hypothetical protein
MSVAVPRVLRFFCNEQKLTRMPKRCIMQRLGQDTNDYKVAFFEDRSLFLFDI